MGLFNLLADQAINVWGQTYDIYLNWIGKIIRWLVEGIGIVGVGIIVFSLLLKVVVLPFDVYQRITMRKQNAQMKANKERMEKLQKQYANNKDLYNQKVMEMYKENGFSMFSSCLPMILSMVIFIVAIGAFNSYSRYASVQNYNDMVKAYNAHVVSYCPDLESGEYTLTLDGQVYIVKGNNADDYVYYTVTAPTEGEPTKDYIAGANKTYLVDSEKVYSAFPEKIDEFLALKNEDGSSVYAEKEIACKEYVITLAQEAVADYYEEELAERTKFLWIKNIWMTDAMYKHPVSDYVDFENEVKQEKFDVNGKKVEFGNLGGTDVYSSSTYETITKKMTTQKSEANGYFVLILLSVGTILLQQWVSMRSQKEQSQFSTVDGQGAQQQKIMMVTMTVMFAFFSFMYSAAFSIYMIVSNLTSLLSTVVINKAVDVTMEKKEQKELQEKYNNRFPGRKYKGEDTDGKKKK